MNTVTLSPKRQLEAFFGHTPSRGPNAGSWMKLNLGDVVHEKDGRHFGRVERIDWSHRVLVRWNDTGWFSELLLTEIERN